MKLKNIKREELETMTFDDMAYMILKEKNKKMKITDIFQIICDALNMNSKEYENQIGDFFTILATEKRFIQLDKGYWDLRENHTSEVNMDDIEDDIEDDYIEDNKEDKKGYYDQIDDIDDDPEDDGLQDLIIVDDIEEDNEI